jgi:hypothetical protein
VSRGEFAGRVEIHESSTSAQDFEPYWCRTGDVIEPNGVAT